MYTSGIQSGTTTRPTYHHANRKQPALGLGPQETCGSPERVRNAFLKQRLRPIAPVSVTRNDYRTDTNYITRENYEYLLASAIRYSEVFGEKLKHDPGLSPGEGIANLYRELDKMVGDAAYLNIEPENERLVFVLWKYYSWGEYNYYWIPVGFVEKLNPQLRRLAISFLHQFSRSNGMATTNESDDFEMMVEHYLERSQDSGEEDPEHLMKMAADYSKNGKVGKLMKRIETKNYYKRLGPALDRYVTQSTRETNLVKLMKRGLEFIRSDKLSITGWGYDPFRDEKCDDYYPVYPDRMIRLTYDVHSDMETELRAWIQEETGNGYEVCPAETLTLRPDGNDVFTMDDYPTRLYRYLDDLLTFLTASAEWTRTY